MNFANITDTVAEAQAVLHLVHEQLNVESLPTEVRLAQLHTAMGLALGRLDRVHDLVFAASSTSA